MTGDAFGYRPVQHARETVALMGAHDQHVVRVLAEGEQQIGGRIAPCGPDQHGDLAASRQRADTRAQLGLEVLHDLRIGRERIADAAQAEALILLDRPVKVQERDVTGVPAAQAGGERDELRDIVALETDQGPERPRVFRLRRREPRLARVMTGHDATGTLADRTVRSATLPSTQRSIAGRPLAPITIRRAWWPRA